MANMKTLRLGSRGPQTELLQLALTRYGYNISVDGIFGYGTDRAVRGFQSEAGLASDGIVGERTWRALEPYLTGYTVHRVARGDTLYKLAARYGTTVSAIETANPGLDPMALMIGARLNIPLGFDVVPTNISFTSTVLEYCAKGLTARYPFINRGSAGSSVMGKSLYFFELGIGGRAVFYNASHHANEWITTPVLLKFLEQYAKAYAGDDTIFDMSARKLYFGSRLYMIPMVDPDGVDLATGELCSGAYYERARGFAESYPAIPFTSGWKANINGVDLNLQYPAGWEEARRIKAEQGYVSPAPRDFVGSAPLDQPESRAVYDFTRARNFALTISYHAQGEIIYWKYLDYEPANSYEIAKEFSRVSGYAVEETPYGSGFAGYKDWFIQEYDRPGYTVEVGIGNSPLPLSQFDRIYADNLGILTTGLNITI